MSYGCHFLASLLALLLSLWKCGFLSRFPGERTAFVWGISGEGRGEVGGEQLTHHLGPHKVQGWVHTLGRRAFFRDSARFIRLYCVVDGREIKSKQAQMTTVSYWRCSCTKNYRKSKSAEDEATACCGPWEVLTTGRWTKSARNPWFLLEPPTVANVGDKLLGTNGSVQQATSTMLYPTVLDTTDNTTTPL